jgi:Pilus formation protein N terminal region
MKSHFQMERATGRTTYDKSRGLKPSFTIARLGCGPVAGFWRSFRRVSVENLMPRTAPSGFRSFSRVAFAALVATLTLAAMPANADPIQVMVNRAKVMRISRPADIVIIGNPGIADATIQDSQTLIITGHSYGTTNLIVLDSTGQSIADELITVSPQDDQLVTVFRRASRQTFSCTPECAPVLVVGDNQTTFDEVNSQIQTSASGSAAK